MSLTNINDSLIFVVKNYKKQINEIIYKIQNNLKNKILYIKTRLIEKIEEQNSENGDEENKYIFDYKLKNFIIEEVNILLLKIDNISIDTYDDCAYILDNLKKEYNHIFEQFIELYQEMYKEFINQIIIKSNNEISLYIEKLENLKFLNKNINLKEIVEIIVTNMEDFKVVELKTLN